MDHRIIVKKLELLRELATLTVLPIAGWQARTAEYPAAGQYRFDGDWAATELPAYFPAGKTGFLQSHVTVPASFPLAESYLQFAFEEMEGLLSIDGEPYAGLDGNHRRVSLPRQGELALAIECMSVPGSYQHPPNPFKRGVYFGAVLQRVSREIEALYYAVRFAAETAEAIDDPRRKALLSEAVEAALLAVDLTLPLPGLLDEVARAQGILEQHLARIQPDAEAGSLYAVGHTHIDTAWLWPLRETVRKCGRTFSTACRLMERYPSFHFTCSQPQLYQYTRAYYPEVYRQIKYWVEAGRWETAGAMWVEADCNITGGEALIRQLLYGLAFFQQEFGTRPRMCWLPDVFGYPASLPEILAGCGIGYFYTYKLHWQARNPFPDHLFHWRGLDGSEVLAHVVNHVWAYNNNFCPAHLAKGWQLYAQKAEYPEVLFPFGFGDGGGGVTEEQMEFAGLALGHFPGLPAVRIGSAEQFFDDVAAAHPTLPTWDGELYVETHRGTYTTQSAIKQANRRSELLLRAAEIIGSLALVTGAAEFNASTLRDAWELVLVNQFHDILPGSSIGMVYREALAAHAEVQARATRALDEALPALLPLTAGDGETVAVFNALCWPRRDLITVTVPEREAPLSLRSADGSLSPAQVVARHDGLTTLIFSGEVPALGYTTFTFSSDPAPRAAAITVTEHLLENQFIRLELNNDGGIIRLYDKRFAREVLPAGAVGNDLQLLQDGPEGEDAWNIHETIDKRRYLFDGITSCTVQETGPVRGGIRVTRAHRDSTLEQDIIIYAHSPRIDFVTRVDWQQRQTVLKVAFPVDIRGTQATYEVQFGAVTRPTHRNTSWDQQKFEVPGQRWVDLSEAGYGVSLLNDARYGFDVHDNVLRMTLLRGTIAPDPEADRGQHTFTYALLPHGGSWVDAETVRRAWELNVPSLTLSGSLRPAAPATHSFITLAGLPVIVEALKPAEDGAGLILRLYEPHGARGEVTVELNIPVAKVIACNLVEEDESEQSLGDHSFRFPIRPFQIRSFRLRV